MEADTRTRRHKLGLSLAGGGFRASLFHLGVLRRMAELDLLRYVEVLSTVSGGSIIGGLYALMLKKYLQRANGGKLERDEYVALMKELQTTLMRGIKKNLRTRLFMNPVRVLLAQISSKSLGKQMAYLYERHLYRDVVQDLVPKDWWERLFHPGRIPLRDIQVRLGDDKLAAGIETYNRQQVDERGSVATKLVLNATSLNSGAPFRFTSVEIGDWRLGYFRKSEISGELRPRKRLLEAMRHESVVKEVEAKLAEAGTEWITIENTVHHRSTLSLTLWWHRRKSDEDGEGAPEGYDGWTSLWAWSRLLGGLADVEFGRLRPAKIAAWYIRRGPDQNPAVDGGLTAEEHMEWVWATLHDIDRKTTGELKKAVGDHAPESYKKDTSSLGAFVLDFILELYWLRSAEVVSSKIDKDWDKLTLGEAVGASACFPPVFPPLSMLGIYDDWYVSRLGLTDGGAYDNLGITALLEERCNHIIASDTSGLFDVRQRASTGRVGMSGRLISIFMNVIADGQRDMLRERRRLSRELCGVLEPKEICDPGEDFKSGKHGDADKDDAPGKDTNPSKDVEEFEQLKAVEDLRDLGTLDRLEEFYGVRELRRLAYFHINSPRMGESNVELDVDREALANVRTDLDGFGDVEIAVLVNCGYELADRYIRKYLADSYYSENNTSWTPDVEFPCDMPADTRRVNRIIRAGRKRIFRAVSLGAPITWLFMALVAAGVIYATWSESLSVREAAESVLNGLLAWGDISLRWLGGGWTDRAVPVGVVILFVITGVLLWKIIRSKVAAKLRQGRKRFAVARRLISAGKWMRSCSGNILWVVGYLPLVIALLSMVVASIVFFFFHLPFMRATRIKERSLE